jgi:transcriptional regulator with XRE-family HTH domain
MNLRRVLGANVRQFRKVKGLAQDELAGLIDLATKTVSDYEVGRVALSYETIGRLAGALGVPEAAFFGVGASTSPAGPRGKLLHRINATLSRMNDTQLARAAKMLEMFTGD